MDGNKVRPCKRGILVFNHIPKRIPGRGKRIFKRGFVLFWPMGENQGLFCGRGRENRFRRWGCL